MSESISTSYLVMIVAIVISVISTLLITFFAYSRAFKTKNKLVDIIEKYEGYNINSNAEIEQYLKDVGYNVRRESKTCPSFNGVSAIGTNSSYAYCIYEFDTNRGKYYTIHVFVNLNIPIINDVLELKVKGQSRTIYDL